MYQELNKSHHRRLLWGFLEAFPWYPGRVVRLCIYYTCYCVTKYPHNIAIKIKTFCTSHIFLRVRNLERLSWAVWSSDLLWGDLEDVRVGSSYLKAWLGPEALLPRWPLARGLSSSHTSRRALQRAAEDMASPGVADPRERERDKNKTAAPNDLMSERRAVPLTT